MLKVLAIVSICAAVVLFVALASMLVLYSSEQTSPHNNNQPPTAEKNYGQNSGMQTSKAPKTGDQKSDNKQKWYYSFVNHPTDWLLVLFNGLLVLATISLFVSGEKSADAAKEAAKAAKQSADVAKSTLISSQRAWIRAKAGVTSPLIFDQNGASTSIWFEITNVGNSPALNVTPNAWLLALTSGGPYPWQEQQRKCGEIRKAGSAMGFTLFPGENFPSEKGFGRWSLGINIRQEDIQKALPASVGGKYVSLYVYGCIDYTFPTDPNNHHQTGFVYELQKKGPDPISPDDGKIEAANLTLMDTGVGMGQQAD
jgi:hypothetical protein